MELRFCSVVRKPSLRAAIGCASLLGAIWAWGAKYSSLFLQASPLSCRLLAPKIFAV